MKTFPLLIILAGSCLAQASRVVLSNEESKADPWFCHSLDCPKYEVLNTTDKYEIRAYEGARWAYTEVDSLLYSVAVTEGFKRLFDYISGKNEENKKIAMTVPVAVNIVPGDGPFCKSIYSIAFFIPFKYQEDPPKPSNPNVIVSAKEKAIVAVLPYGGYVFDDWSVSSKANKLKSALDADKVSYNDTSFFNVGYDPPTRLQHRHNEIWIRLTSEVKVTQ